MNGYETIFFLKMTSEQKRDLLTKFRSAEIEDNFGNGEYNVGFLFWEPSINDAFDRWCEENGIEPRLL